MSTRITHAAPGAELRIAHMLTSQWLVTKVFYDLLHDHMFRGMYNSYRVTVAPIINGAPDLGNLYYFYQGAGRHPDDDPQCLGTFATLDLTGTWERLWVRQEQRLDSAQ